jgi:predicted ABC-type transport system involved in lysophospholipase L1 biosynthesis ATPase subunit
VTPVVVQIAGVSKDYHGLRPLRIQQLVVAAGESVAIVGFDRISAEVFVNLVTGATLPDAGSIALFGRPTAEISDSAEWLALVDRFGIVSDRAVLLEQLTVVQNLAMPFTLDIEPPPDAVRVRAERLAGEVGLDERTWTAPVAEIGAPAKTRVRVGRALALDPAVLLLEHASAGLERAAAASEGGTTRLVPPVRLERISHRRSGRPLGRPSDGLKPSSRMRPRKESRFDAQLTPSNSDWKPDAGIVVLPPLFVHARMRASRPGNVELAYRRQIRAFCKKLRWNGN